jgi:hypothetical protein
MAGAQQGPSRDSVQRISRHRTRKHTREEKVLEGGMNIIYTSEEASKNVVSSPVLLVKLGQK